MPPTYENVKDKDVGEDEREREEEDINDFVNDEDDIKDDDDENIVENNHELEILKIIIMKISISIKMVTKKR